MIQIHKPNWTPPPPQLLALPPERRMRAYLRNDYKAFLAKAYRTVSPGQPLDWNWHLDMLCEYLMAVERGDVTRLVVNVPPRTLKSISTTVALPAWALGRNPSSQIIAASYSSALAIKHSTDTRLIMEADWYKEAFPSTVLSSDQNAKQKFVTTERGFRFATSVGGTSTGEGGDLLIVDDPTNPEQAMSEVERTTANRWFDQTFLSRLNDRKTGRIIVVMQRLHKDDLTGHILEKGGWTHVNLPLIAESQKTYTYGKGRNETIVTLEEGDILHEARFPPPEIKQLKRDMGSYAFSAQYQQSPVPLEGGLIKHSWLKYYKQPLESYDYIVDSWDTGIKSGAHNDPSACLTIGVKGNEAHVLDYYTARLEYPELKRMVTAKSAQLHCGERPSIVLIEDKASGQSLIQDLRRETAIPVVPCMPVGDKIVRLAAESAKIEAGMLLLPEDAPWLAAFVTELTLFPATTHDEVVDTLSQFFKWFSARLHSGYRIRRL